MNVTLVPEHIVVAVAEILTLAGRFGFTVIALAGTDGKGLVRPAEGRN